MGISSGSGGRGRESSDRRGRCRQPWQRAPSGPSDPVRPLGVGGAGRIGCDLLGRVAEAVAFCLVPNRPRSRRCRHKWPRRKPVHWAGDSGDQNGLDGAGVAGGGRGCGEDLGPAHDADRHRHAGPAESHRVPRRDRAREWMASCPASMRPADRAPRANRGRPMSASARTRRPSATWDPHRPRIHAVIRRQAQSGPSRKALAIAGLLTPNSDAAAPAAKPDRSW